MPRYILALDQGTTSSRALLFGHDGNVVAQARQEFEQLLPRAGHVEHDPEAIWDSQLAVARQVLQQAGVGPESVAAIGIANQRETTVLWERSSGKPIGNAIVWQSRITADICRRLKDEGLDETFRSKTGLVIDPYFSGTKIQYLLDQHNTARARAAEGDVLFGTVDSFLLWRLTGGRVHATDASNASRTLLYNIYQQDWDDELLELLDVPRAMLPEVLDSSYVYAETDESWFGRPIPVAGMAGDQQAATFGQVCFAPGDAKNTYGTGCFLLMNTGGQPVESKHNLLTTIGWRIHGELTYCLEGSVFIAGAVVQWLRDGLGLIEHSEDVERLAAEVPDSEGVYFVPAFVGLGAPHWDPYARGAIFGLTRGTKAGHIARAAVESMAYQSRDLLEAMAQDASVPLKTLKVDGGAAVNDELLQFQADIVGAPVQRPQIAETTATGAAYLAGLAVGFWSDQQDLKKYWSLDRQFDPHMDSKQRESRYNKWKSAVNRTLNWEQ